MKKYFLLCIGKEDKTTTFCGVEWKEYGDYGQERPVAPVYSLEVAEGMKSSLEEVHSDKYVYLISEAPEEYLKLIGEANEG